MISGKIKIEILGGKDRKGRTREETERKRNKDRLYGNRRH